MVSVTRRRAHLGVTAAVLLSVTLPASASGITAPVPCTLEGTFKFSVKSGPPPSVVEESFRGSGVCALRGQVTLTSSKAQRYVYDVGPYFFAFACNLIDPSLGATAPAKLKMPLHLYDAVGGGYDLDVEGAFHPYSVIMTGHGEASMNGAGETVMTRYDDEDVYTCQVDITNGAMTLDWPFGSES